MLSQPNHDLDTLFEEVSTYFKQVEAHLKECTICTKTNINSLHEVAIMSKTRWAVLTKDDKR